MEMISWKTVTREDFEILVKERDANRARAEYAEAKLRHVASIMKVCDGGQYINDWREKQDRLERDAADLEDYRALKVLGTEYRDTDPVCVWVRYNRAAWEALSV